MNSIIKYGALAVSIIMVTGALVVPMTLDIIRLWVRQLWANVATPATAVTAWLAAME